MRGGGKMQHHPLLTELLERVSQSLGQPAGGFQEKISSLTPTENMIRTGILLTMAEGRHVNINELIQMGKRIGEDVPSILSHLKKLDLLHWDEETGIVTVAYPFSGVPTPHRVTIVGKQPTFAMCAIDALGIPAMFEADVHIDSTCAYCGKQLRIDVQNLVPHAKPDTVVVGVGTVAHDDSCCETCESDEPVSLSTSCCPAIQFFCSEEHWQQLKKQDAARAGERLTLPEAFAVAIHIFGASLQGFKNELIVQTHVDKLVLESNRFTCQGCINRVIEAIEAIEALGRTEKIELQGNRLVIWASDKTIQKQLVTVAQKALESDPLILFLLQ